MALLGLGPISRAQKHLFQSQRLTRKLLFFSHPLAPTPWHPCVTSGWTLWSEPGPCQAGVCVFALLGGPVPGRERESDTLGLRITVPASSQNLHDCQEVCPDFLLAVSSPRGLVRARAGPPSSPGRATSSQASARQ